MITSGSMLTHKFGHTYSSLSFIYYFCLKKWTYISFENIKHIHYIKRLGCWAAHPGKEKLGVIWKLLSAKTCGGYTKYHPDYESGSDKYDLPKTYALFLTFNVCISSINYRILSIKVKGGG